MNYQKIYLNLIHKAQTRLLEDSVYTESHHIIPRCMGGTDDKNNLVDLTPEEHLTLPVNQPDGMLLLLHMGN